MKKKTYTFTTEQVEQMINSINQAIDEAMIIEGMGEVYRRIANIKNYIHTGDVNVDIADVIYDDDEFVIMLKEQVEKIDNR